jgi:hypothetical protein
VAGNPTALAVGGCQCDILVAVERTALVIRENEPGPSVFFAFEWIITIDDIATLKN